MNSIALTDKIPSISSSEGVPTNYKIIINYFKYESPGNKGFFINISAIIKPTAHISKINILIIF